MDCAPTPKSPHISEAQIVVLGPATTEVTSADAGGLAWTVGFARDGESGNDLRALNAPWRLLRLDGTAADVSSQPPIIDARAGWAV
jgi:hypothetical protein